MLRKSKVLSPFRLSALASLVATASLALIFLSGCAKAPKSVSVSAASTTVDATDTTTVTATVTNDSNNAGVTWSTSVGSLSSQATSSATFTAPAATAAAQTAIITATSVADNTKSDTVNITIPAAVSVTTAALPAAAVGTAYTQQLAASGGIPAYTWTLVSGSLPSCLSINSAGVISGTPTASCVGTSNLTFKAMDSGTPNALSATSVALSLNIAAAPAIALPAPGLLSGGVIGTPYSVSLAATGGAGTLTYSISAGALPTGLTISPAGAVSGTPTAAGTFNFTVMAADAFGDSQTQSYSIKIAYPPVTIAPASGALPIAFTGSSYAQTLTAGGGSGAGFVWTVTGLPAAGISYSANGGTLSISGTPNTPSNISFTASVKDGAGDSIGPFSYTIAVYNPISLPATNPATLPANTTINIAYSGTITASGGSGSGYTWTVSGLSDGLTSSNNGGTLTISGTPTTAGTVTFTVSVKDSSGSSTGPITYTIAVNSVLTLPATNPATLPGIATTGTAFSGTITASGGSGTGYVFTVTGLPSDGISSSSSGGTLTISGTPTTAATITFNVSVKDSVGNTAGPFTYTINVYNPLTLPAPNPNSLGSANINLPYSGTVTVAGGSGSGYVWTVTGLSDGLNYTTSGATLTISGTPTSVATVTFIASVTDSVNNSTGPITYTIQVYNGLTLPVAPPNTLPANAQTGTAYSGTIVAQGGSGSGYVFTVTGLADGLTSSSSGSTLTISGTPTSPQLVSFNVSVKDSANNSAGPITYSISVNAPLALPASNPNTLPSATINQAYLGSINGSGGVLPYTWTVNGSVVPSNGSTVALSGGQGLTVSASNTNALSFAGTPTALANVPFTVQLKDSLGNTVGPFNYSIQINLAAAAVSGTVRLVNNCGGVTSLPTYTVTINTNPIQQTTTDSNGSYSFPSVPNGTYTITPSITGPSSLFFPATLANVAVSGNPLTGLNFQVSLGYTVSGNVSYSGAGTGQVYLNVSNTICSGGQSHGTSIPSSSIGSGGAFTIRGVPPGLYNLTASMDTLGFGAANTSDPNGINPGLNISTANLSGVAVIMNDPELVAPSQAPGFKAVTPMDHGVVINFQPITGNNGNEAVTSYLVQWSTDSTFNTAVNSAIFNAIGTGTNVWIINNGTAGISGSFANGSSYYFRALGQLSAGNGPWGVWGGGTPTAVKIGAPSGGNTITGAVTIPAGINPTGPLYVGFYDENTGAVFAEKIANPVVGANAYSIQVPTSTDPYFNFAILDQNNDGLIDTGDVSNTDNSTNLVNEIIINSGLSNQNITLPSANAIATVQTQYQSITYNGGSGSFYQLNFNLRAANKLPVAVKLISGPNVISPIDIGSCLSCGHVQFQTEARLGYIGPDILPPNVGDTYAFSVTYSDGSTQTVNGVVTGWAGGSTIVAAPDLATNLAPFANSSNSITPTFTWTYPPSASSFTYQFTITDDSGDTYWTIPANNSNLSGFPSTVTQIVWGTDPTGDASNTPSIPSLVVGGFYPWQITVQDANGNSALTATYYIP
jgi:hypothetical protein